MKTKKKVVHAWASDDGKRCRRKQPGTGNPGKTVKFFCPATCKEQCSSEAPTISPSESPTVPREECENDVNFLLKKKEGQDCAWASDG